MDDNDQHMLSGSGSPFTPATITITKKGDEEEFDRLLDWIVEDDNAEKTNDLESRTSAAAAAADKQRTTTTNTNDLQDDLHKKKKKKRNTNMYLSRTGNANIFFRTTFTGVYWRNTNGNLCGFPSAPGGSTYFQFMQEHTPATRKQLLKQAAKSRLNSVEVDVTNLLAKLLLPILKNDDTVNINGFDNTQNLVVLGKLCRYDAMEHTNDEKLQGVTLNAKELKQYIEDRPTILEAKLEIIPADFQKDDLQSATTLNRTNTTAVLTTYRTLAVFCPKVWKYSGALYRGKSKKKELGASAVDNITAVNARGGKERFTVFQVMVFEKQNGGIGKGSAQDNGKESSSHLDQYTCVSHLTSTAFIVGSSRNMRRYTVSTKAESLVAATSSSSSSSSSPSSSSSSLSSSSSEPGGGSAVLEVTDDTFEDCLPFTSSTEPGILRDGDVYHIDRDKTDVQTFLLRTAASLPPPRSASVHESKRREEQRGKAENNIVVIVEEEKEQKEQKEQKEHQQQEQHQQQRQRSQDKQQEEQQVNPTVKMVDAHMTSNSSSSSTTNDVLFLGLPISGQVMLLELLIIGRLGGFVVSIVVDFVVYCIVLLNTFNTILPEYSCCRLSKNKNKRTTARSVMLKMMRLLFFLILMERWYSFLQNHTAQCNDGKGAYRLSRPVFYLGEVCWANQSYPSAVSNQTSTLLGSEILLTPSQRLQKSWLHPGVLRGVVANMYQLMHFAFMIGYVAQIRLLRFGLPVVMVVAGARVLFGMTMLLAMSFAMWSDRFTLIAHTMESSFRTIAM